MPEAIQLTNIYDSFTQLGERVHVTLRTQLGDLSRLNAQKAVCLQFLEAIETGIIHLNIIPPAERHVIHASVDYMIHELEAAATISSDSPDADPISLGNQLQTGAVGRPSIQILPTDLAVFRKSVKATPCRTISLSPLHHPSSTARIQPIITCPPVYVDEEQADASERGLILR
ncbi:hypothetical protein K503DRAFT_869643 [Rhizopogon vinicolor AM-OR11-026]|uniref:Uncharacterized protein n=1 Tax=Rhizopogon vinicolor AM-OR11-026 TaxID=1314800 RepID=A0A1B7ML09_9AGAM|nr:hypothetical protein K503DRAFT_869643 [Rhizopogon vinicolor AM-OR11-026]